MTIFEIIPLVGAGELRFDMDRNAVRSTLGKPTRSWNDFRGKTVDNWPGVSICYSAEEGLVEEIVVSPPACATLNGENLFERDRGIEIVRRIDAAPRRWMGSIVFLDAGISLHGWLELDSELAVAVGPRGYWMPYHNRMEAFDG